MRPFRVRAYTPAGFAAADPWSPALDGILAYQVLREQLGEEAFALGQTGHLPVVDPDLPLLREAEEESGQWWWCCSAPRYTAAGVWLRYYHRRFDAHFAEQYTAARKVLTSAGPFKQYRVPSRVVLAPVVEWHAIGDPDAVARLLRGVSHIGAGRGRGLGRVVRWEVQLDGDPNLARFWRPLPLAFALRYGREGLVMEYGIRPPGRQHRVLCVLPVQNSEQDAQWTSAR
jgi:hypothetical protein